jgi:hypothetical protein
MSDKHLSQTERYQIYAPMKAGHLPAKIVSILLLSKQICINPILTTLGEND